MQKTDTVTFQRKAFATGGSMAVIIPPELCDFLGIDSTSDLILAAYSKKKGKFIAVWKKK